MKKALLIALLSVNWLATYAITAPFIGQQAPEFKADSVQNEDFVPLSLSDYPDKYKILIFYPSDFSFVCPTELFAFQDKKDEFEKRNTVLLGISVDQKYSHLAWLKQPRDKGGIQGITYPLVADVTKQISKDYGILDEANGVALRGVYILDKENKIQHVSINNLKVGRSIEEVLRVLDAIQKTEGMGDVCPANWHNGQETIKPSQQDLEKYLEKENHSEQSTASASEQLPSTPQEPAQSTEISAVEPENEEENFAEESIESETPKNEETV